MPKLSEVIAQIPWPQTRGELVIWPEPYEFDFTLPNGYHYPPLGPRAPECCVFGGAYQQLTGAWPRGAETNTAAEEVLRRCGLDSLLSVTVPAEAFPDSGGYYKPGEEVSLRDLLFVLNDHANWTFDQIAALLAEWGY